MRVRTEKPPKARSFSLFAFFALAYIISWSLALLARPDLLPFPVPGPVKTLAGLLYHFGPAVAAIIGAAYMAGRKGIGNLLRPLKQWRVAPQWYAFVILYPPLLHLASLAIGRAWGGPAPKFFDSASIGLPPGNPLLTGAGIFLGTLLLTGLAEEIGWRGFALPRLQRDMSALGASLLIGLLWAIWHYNPLNVPVVRLMLPWHFLLVLNMSILMTFVYNNTKGSLWMVVLFHAVSNFTDWLIPTSPAALGDLRPLTAQVLLQFAAAIAVVAVFGGKWLRRDRPELQAAKPSPLPQPTNGR